MAWGIIGTLCLVGPVALPFAPMTEDPAKDALTLALLVLGAVLPLAAVMGHGACSKLRSVTPAGALAAWLLLTSALGDRPLTSLAALWPFLVGLGLWGCVTLSRPPSRWIATWWVCLGASTFAVAVFALWPPEWLPWDLAGQSARHRHASLFGNPLSVGDFLAPALCLALAALLTARSLLGRAAAAALLAVGLAALVATAARGPVLGAFAGFGAVALLALPERARSLRVILLGLGLILVAGAVHFALGSRSPARSLTARMGESLDLRSESIRLRLTTWTLGSRMVWRAPMLGHGWGSFEYLFQEEMGRALDDDPDGIWELEAYHLNGRIAHQAHCDYLEIAVNGGLVALALFLWILSSGLTSGIGSLRSVSAAERWPRVGAIGAVVCSAVTMAVGFPLQRPIHMAVFWIALGVCRASGIRREVERP
jgi:O-antigen ligase